MQSRKAKVKKILKVVIPVLVVVLIVGGFIRSRQAGQENEMMYRLTALNTTDVMETVTANGKIASRESYDVAAVRDGKINKINVTLGQRVKKGQILAEMDDSSIQNEIRKSITSSTIDLKTAEMNKRNKAKDLENANFLFSLGEISKDELRKVQQEYDLAAMEYSNKSAGNDISILKQQLNDTKLKAPISGVVTAVNAKAGGITGGVIFVVENTDELILSANVSEYDIKDVVPGQRAIIKTELTGDKEIIGRVSMVAPAATKPQGQVSTNSADKVEFKVEVKIEDKDPNLKIGTSARGKIVIKERKDVFAVPIDALKKDAKGSYIFAAVKSKDQYKAKKIRVDAGLETDMLVEISGDKLKSGMKIIANPGAVKDGETFVAM